MLVGACVAASRHVGRSPGCGLRELGIGMPHVNDRRDFAQCTGLLGGPRHLHYAARVNGRRTVDTQEAGQQEFQALLLWCLLSPERTIGWDASVGRCFRDMHSYYSWASPQPACLATGWSVAARVSRYLLPIVESHGSGPRPFSGIPGLRFAGTGNKRITLKHLPTGGVLDLYDAGRCDANMMKDMLLVETRPSRSEQKSPLWLESQMTSIELASLADWNLAAHSELLSAIMARINVLWRHWDNRAQLRFDTSTGILWLSWQRGPGAQQFAQLLTESSIRIRRARSAHLADHSPSITLGSSVLELRGPGTRVRPLDR